MDNFSAEYIQLNINNHHISYKKMDNLSAEYIQFIIIHLQYHEVIALLSVNKVLYSHRLNQYLWKYRLSTIYDTNDSELANCNTVKSWMQLSQYLAMHGFDVYKSVFHVCWCNVCDGNCTIETRLLPKGNGLWSDNTNCTNLSHNPRCKPSITDLFYVLCVKVIEKHYGLYVGDLLTYLIYLGLDCNIVYGEDSGCDFSDTLLNIAIVSSNLTALQAMIRSDSKCLRPMLDRLSSELTCNTLLEENELGGIVDLCSDSEHSKMCNERNAIIIKSTLNIISEQILFDTVVEMLLRRHMCSPAGNANIVGQLISYMTECPGSVRNLIATAKCESDTAIDSQENMLEILMITHKYNNIAAFVNCLSIIPDQWIVDNLSALTAVIKSEEYLKIIQDRLDR